MSVFSKNLKRYLDENNFKQKVIAKLSNMSPSKLSKIINGNQSPTEDDMQRISNALKKDIDFFISDKFEGSSNQSEKTFSLYLNSKCKDVNEDVLKSLKQIILNTDRVLSAEARVNSFSSKEGFFE